MNNKRLMLVKPILFIFCLALFFFNSGCVFPVADSRTKTSRSRTKIGIDPFETRTDKRKIKHYQKQGLSEKEARQQAFEDRFMEGIRDRRRSESYDKYQETRRQRDFEQHFRKTMEKQKKQP